MTVFLDANVVIYFVERHPLWSAKATARIAAARSSGDDLAVSDLIRMECQVGPLSSGDQALLADFAKFFSRPEVHVLPITAAVCDRAAAIRARYRFKPLDALHLAAAAIRARYRFKPLDALHLAVAVSAGCGKFLANDTGLRNFPDTNVEILI